MKKIAAALLLLSTLALTPAAQAPAGWVKLDSPEGRFSVMLPAQPGPPKVQSAHDPMAGPYKTQLFMAKADGEAYVVGWVDYSPQFDFSVQRELEANRDKFVAGIKAKLLGTTQIKLGAHPGIEFAAEVSEPALRIRSRVYVVGRRPYQLIAITPAGRDSTRNVERFFSSFELARAE